MFGDNQYNKLIRKYYFSFGTIFNDLHVERKNANGDIVQTIAVPLIYGGKDRQASRWKQDPSIDRMPQIILPTMSFEYTNLIYDASRQLNPISKLAYPSSNGYASVLYNSVPYDIPINLYIYVEKTEDGTQIVEQILPNFHPDFVLPIELIPEMGVKLNIPVVYNGLNYMSNHEGNFPIKEVTAIWTLQFTMKAWLYGPIKEKKLIRFVQGNLLLSNTTEVLNSVTIQPGLTANGTPTSNVNESVDVHTINIDDDYGYVKIIT